MAILAAAAVNVPPHAPLTARQIHFQLHDAGVRWLIVSTPRTARQGPPSPRRAAGPARRRADGRRGAGRRTRASWRSFLQRGRRALPRLADELRRREERLGPDDLATIMYTSGTTGNPKGVMLTHGNLLSNSLAALEVMPHRPGDLVLNWLPFTHIYARTVDHYICMAAGTPVALAESAETLVQNLDEVQPTHFASVPRFYEKVLTSAARPIPRRRADGCGACSARASTGCRPAGRRCRRPIARAYHAAGLLVLQGYGLTETSPIITFNCKDHYKLDTVGRPLPGVEVRIAPDGEVLTRGPHVMKGYWNDAGGDGGGDPRRLAAHRRPRRTRRRRLSAHHGPQKGSSGAVQRQEGGAERRGGAAARPTRASTRRWSAARAATSCAALLVPAWDNVRRALRQEGVELAGGPEEWAKRPEVRGLLERRVRAALADVSGAEQVKKFLILPRPFSVAADELTVSLKLRRSVVVNRYADQIEELYRGGTCV